MADFMPDPFDEHTRLVDLIAAAGVTPPDEWVSLRSRLKLFNQIGTPLLSRLSAAVVDGSDADIEALRASAIAEQQAAPKVSSAVRAAVLKRMREVYSVVAVDNYNRMVKIFDEWATKFVATTRLVDVEADGAAIVDQPDKERRAWLDSQRYSAQLTKLVPILHGAAHLTGMVPERARRDGGGRDAVLIPLCCNITDQHRRRVWLAWRNIDPGADSTVVTRADIMTPPRDTRCGRWSALTAAGIPIRALPKLDEFEPYRPPRPVEQRIKPTPGDPIHTGEYYYIDPEDEPQPQEPELAKPRIRHLAR
jgi:hypothetical protein